LFIGSPFDLMKWGFGVAHARRTPHSRRLPEVTIAKPNTGRQFKNREPMAAKKKTDATRRRRAGGRKGERERPCPSFRAQPLAGGRRERPVKAIKGLADRLTK
jgi:hypothetical protein